MSPWWADVAAVVGVVGTLLTLIGLAIGLYQLVQAVRQVRQQVDVSVATSRAILETYEKLRRQHAAHVFANARRYSADLKRHVQSGNWDLALVRMTDLREQVAQLDASGDADELAGIRRGLGEWESVLRRQKPDRRTLTRPLFDRWLEFTERVAVALERDANPLRRPENPHRKADNDSQQ